MSALDRLPNETLTQYTAFKDYVAMGDGLKTRSLRKLAEQTGRDLRNLARWSKDNNWRKRLLQWQIEESHRMADASEQAKLEHAREIERRKRDVESKAMQAFDALFPKIMTAAQFPVGKEVELPDEVETSTDGKTTIIKRKVVQPVNFRLADLTKMTADLVTLARLTLGMTTSKGEMTGAEGAPLNPIASPVITIINKDDDTKHRDLAAEFRAAYFRN